MREGSKSLLTLEAALAMATGAGAQATLADVHALDLPMFRPGQDPRAIPALAWLLAEVRAADALLLCSPTYHGTVSGAVKNALDALDALRVDEPRYLGGKVIGLMALGGGSAANAVNALHHAVRGLNGLTAPTVVTIPGNAVDPTTGTIRDEAVRLRMATMVAEVLDLTRRLRPTAVAAGEGLGRAAR